jgi:hypothetical protein
MPRTLSAGDSFMVEKQLSLGIVWANADYPRVSGHMVAVGDKLGIDGSG